MYRWRGLGAVSVQDLISSTASQYGVPSSLALAVAQKESGLNQGAMGTKGERGVFQLMPATAAGLGVDPTDLSQNVQGGIRYLSQLYSQFGDWRTALEAYNGGPGNVQRGTVPGAAVSYADSILGALDVGGSDLLGGDAGAAVPPDLAVSAADYGLSDSSGLSGAVWAGLGLAVAALVVVSIPR